MRLIIFANGHIENYSFCREYLTPDCRIICCDGGVRHTRALDIIPEFILGDFDSADNETVDFYEKKGVIFTCFNSEKDETDSELALNFGFELGASDIILMGATGSRLDHSLANIFLLYRALSRNVRLRIINENNCIEATDGTLEISATAGQLVSVLPLLGDVSGVTLEGFKYPITNGSIPFSSPIGISNVMLSNKASVSVKSGVLLVILAHDM